MKGARAPIRPRAFYIPIRRNVRVIDAQVGGALGFNGTWTPPVRFAGNPIINYGGGGWKDSQVQEPCVFIDPTDTSKVIMVFAGMAAPVATGVQSLGLATATVADPFTWTESPSNPWVTLPVSLRCGSARPLGGGSVQVFAPEVSDGTINIISSSNLTYATANAGTATGSDIGAFFGINGDETQIVQACIFEEGPDFYLVYFCSTSPIGDPSGLLKSVRLASYNGSFTHYGEILHVGTDGATGDPDGHFIEGGQVIKVGSKYILTYSAYRGSDTEPHDWAQWTICMASADSMTGPWTKSPLNPVFTGSGVPGAVDRWHVATPYWLQLGSTWYLFYQAGNLDPATDFYYNNNWSLCMATLQPGLTPLDALGNSGPLSIQANKSIAAALATSGSTAKQVTKSIAATLSFIGGLTKRANKAVAGTLNLSGALSAAAAVIKNLSGTLSFSGAMSTVVAVVKNLSGILSFTGEISRRMNKVLSGTLSLTGTVGRLCQSLFSGTLSFAGAMSKQVFKSLAGVLGFLGGLITRLFGEQVIAADKRADGTLTSSRTAGIAQTNVTDGKLTWEKNE